MDPTHSYRVLIDIGAMHFIRGLRGKNRKAVEQLIDDLHAQPFMEGTIQEADEKGRTIDVYIIGEFRVRTWHDRADNHLKVLSVR